MSPTYEYHTDMKTHRHDTCTRMRKHLHEWVMSRMNATRTQQRINMTNTQLYVYMCMHESCHVWMPHRHSNAQTWHMHNSTYTCAYMSHVTYECHTDTTMNRHNTCTRMRIQVHMSYFIYESFHIWITLIWVISYLYTHTHLGWLRLVGSLKL